MCYYTELSVKCCSVVFTQIVMKSSGGSEI